MTLNVQPGFNGVVGPMIDATDLNGAACKVVMPGATLVDATGAAAGTSGNPIYVSGGTGGSTAPYQATPTGYQQLAMTGAAQALTVPATSTFAVIQAEGVDARWRDDGTNPTASVGMILYAGPNQVFSGDLSVLKFIQTAAGSTLNISYYK